MDVRFGDEWLRFSPYSKDIRICLTLRNISDRSSTCTVFPSAQQFALLHVPAQHFLIGANYGSASAGRAIRDGSSILVGRPDYI